MRSLTVYSLILIAALIASTTNAAQKGEFRLTVVDEQSGQPIACRMHLKNARGIPQKAGRQPFLKDHFVFDGKVTLSLREGNYKFEAESGPEYHTRGGHFSVNRFSSDQKTISMRRFADLAKEGWWSGDMYVNRSPRDIELLMRAEDLHVAQLLGWPSRKSDRDTMNSGSPIVKLADSRYYHKLAGRDVRAGGGICFFKLDAVPEIFANGKLANEFPPAVELAQDLKKQGAWVEADMASCWDLPLWVAHQTVDSIRLLDQRFGRERFSEDTTGQFPRDAAIYADASGAGRWSEYIYYQLLNCGLQIPPTAGSGSGDTPNPVGLNRVYVYCGEYFSPAKWWQALREGKVVLTNGPLLRPFVEGHPPGHVFHADQGQIRRLQFDLKLATKEKIEYLEVIKNGAIAVTVRLDEFVNRNGQLPPVAFKRSGWCMVRVVTNARGTHQVATSGPFYVQIGDEPIRSKRSAEFFRDWIAQRVEQIENIDDASQRQHVMDYHRSAAEYWDQMVRQANRD
ncbi:MAG: CehA/McbA family metallohydrolase [Pirellulales bacterium]